VELRALEQIAAYVQLLRFLASKHTHSSDDHSLVSTEIYCRVPHVPVPICVNDFGREILPAGAVASESLGVDVSEEGYIQERLLLKQSKAISYV
jgi:hypothetical protein